MAIRRTQEQKERAFARKLQLIEEKSLSIDPEVVVPKTPVSVTGVKKVAISDILHTDVSLLKRDLVKTVVITLLLLGCIFGIFIYLG
jgi:hypothetical protein